MKKILLGAVVLSLTASAWAQSPRVGPPVKTNWDHSLINEIDLSFSYFFPSQQFSGIYDKGYGVEAQYDYWLSKPFGVAAVLGLMTVDVQSDLGQLVDPSVATFRDSVSLVPIGISGLYNLIEYEDWRFDLEAGLRYIFINSDAKRVTSATGASDKVSMDDAFVAIFRASLDRRLSDQFAAFVNTGVQVDLDAGDLSAAGEKLGGNNLKGYSLAIGVKYLY